MLSAKSATSATTAGSAATAGTATSATTATTAGAANALNGVVIVKGANVANPIETQSHEEVTCPSGMHALGGGVQDDGLTEEAVNEMFIGSAETGTATNTFTAFVNNTSKTKADTFHVWAICANASVTGTAF